MDTTTPSETNSREAKVSKLADKFGLILKRISVPLAWAPITTIKDESGEECQYMELIPSSKINLLRLICREMIESGHTKECCQVYASVRMSVMDEKLEEIEIEKVTVEDLEIMESDEIQDGAEKWAKTLKTVVESILLAEQELFQLVFEDTDSVKGICFSEASEVCLMDLLRYAKEMAVVTLDSEKLLGILNMFKALSAAFPRLMELFSNDESGRLVIAEAREVLEAFCRTVKSGFRGMELALEVNESSTVVENGEVHSLTVYVMNYVKLVLDYSDKLNVLLKHEDDETAESLENEEMSAIGRLIVRLIFSLGNNLELKSKLYNDIALGCIFLMNNANYIVQSVKDSELAGLLGEKWVTAHEGLIKQHSTSYLDESWSKILKCLEIADGSDGSSSEDSLSVLEEKIDNFNTSFEDLYKTQTGWNIPDPQLKDELWEVISVKVLPAYRDFLATYTSRLERSQHSADNLKYSSKDLEGLLLDLFQGVPLQVQK